MSIIAKLNPGIAITGLADDLPVAVGLPDAAMAGARKATDAAQGQDLQSTLAASCVFAPDITDQTAAQNLPTDVAVTAAHYLAGASVVAGHIVPTFLASLTTAVAGFTPDFLNASKIAPFEPVDFGAHLSSADGIGAANGLIDALGIGGFSNGNISSLGQTDQYSFVMQAGHTYTFNLFGNSSGDRNSLSDTFLRLFPTPG